MPLTATPNSISASSWHGTVSVTATGSTGLADALTLQQTPGPRPRVFRARGARPGQADVDQGAIDQDQELADRPPVAGAPPGRPVQFQEVPADAAGARGPRRHRHAARKA